MIDPSNPRVRDLPSVARRHAGASSCRPAGRGTSLNPTSRFERFHVEADPDPDTDGPSRVTTLYRDSAKSILVPIDSTDVGFDWGLNPYRGCEHGCVYCYARPMHEYLGFSAGLDFETRIVVKHDAPRLLRARLRSRSWTPRPILISGATDPYQPIEHRLRLTRGCLEVLSDARHPVAVITKNERVARDADLLAPLAAHGAAGVTISVTSLRRDLQARMEPRTSTPRRRLDAIRALAAEGIPVGVNLAPVIPGLTDTEIPDILTAAREAGAMWAGYILLRLPHGVKELFSDWLERYFPNRRERVLNRLREMHGGQLYDATIGVRGRGSGPYADQIKALFRTTARRLGYGPPPALNSAAFRTPPPEGQLTLPLNDAGR